MNPLKLFFKYLSTYRTHVTYTLVYSFLNSIINLSIPFFIQLLITFISTGVIFTSWYVLVVLLGLVIIFSGILQVYQLDIAENIQQNLFRRIALNLHNRILKGAFIGKNAIELSNHLYEAILLQKSVPKILIDLPTAILQVLLGFLIISYYHPFFAILVMIMLLGIYLTIKSIGGKTFNLSIEESESKYATLHWLQIKGDDEENTGIIGNSFSWDRLDTYISNYLDRRNRHFKMLKNHYITLIVTKVSITLILMFFGGVLVKEKIITFGQFVASELIILIMIAAIEKIIFTVDIIYDMLTNIYKIEKALTIRPQEEIPLQEVNIHFPLTIKFKDLVININGVQRCLNDKILLQKAEQKQCSPEFLEHLYFTLHQHKALVKSGELLFNGINILKCNYDHHDMLFINRRNKLFKGTIRDNICLMRDMSDMDLITLLDKFKMLEPIQGLEWGINTVITYDEVLSDDLIYKIILLRALLMRPALLIVDNLFSYLDNFFIEKYKEEIKKKDITLIYS